MERGALAGGRRSLEMDAAPFGRARSDQGPGERRGDRQHQSAVADSIAPYVLLPALERSSLTEGMPLRCGALEQEHVSFIQPKAVVRHHERIAMPTDALG